jgi:hypothetical protein
VAPAPVPPHLSAAHGPTGGYCLSKPFFSLLLSSLTDRGGAEEARFSGFAAPALPDTYRPMGGRQVREPEPPEPCQRGPKLPRMGRDYCFVCLLSLFFFFCPMFFCILFFPCFIIQFYYGRTDTQQKKYTTNYSSKILSRKFIIE